MDNTNDLQSSMEFYNGISAASAMIQFTVDGTILHANENFLAAVGYRLDEVVGKHHRIFVSPEYAESEDYRQFWQRLASGEAFVSEFPRFGKAGQKIWLQAIYCPIRDHSGAVVRVGKVATDVTSRVNARLSATDLSEQTAQNVQVVAAATEEMYSSISEISQNMLHSRSKMDEAVNHTHSSVELMKSLNERAQSMQHVIKLIRDIASKTNLLALNATIEAARAGDAGRGFAVVAGEVKNLANQTNTAIDDVMAEIEGIRDVTSKVAKSTHVTDESISQVNEYLTSLSSAVEEQTAAVNEISSSMQDASQSINQLSEALVAIAVTD